MDKTKNDIHSNKKSAKNKNIICILDIQIKAEKKRKTKDYRLRVY
jgi:hypothetical protein